MEIKRTLVTRSTDFHTREESSGELFIEGYFAVFDDMYYMGKSWFGDKDIFEKIDPQAFNSSMNNDIRVLLNHNTDIVLGRKSAGTAEFRIDEKGLWGRCKINPKDMDAVSAYARVDRKDVSQCSIGFNILADEVYEDEDQIVWTLKDIDLWECSIVTFPAYEGTSIEARKRDADALEKVKLEAWKSAMRSKISAKED